MHFNLRACIISNQMVRHYAFLPVPLQFFPARSRNLSHIEPLLCSATIAPNQSKVAFVLSHFEARDILKLQKQSSEAPAIIKGPFSVDLGRRSLDHLLLLPEGIATVSDNNEQSSQPVIATWNELNKMCKKGRSGAYECYTDGQFQPSKIADISHETNRTASLYPCAPYKPPTVILGGFGMHRLKGTDPAADTQAKLRAIGSAFLKGNVLDICTGLGYTAIATAHIEHVTRVSTIELDPVIVAMQRRNPWSTELFSSPKINRIEGDATVVVKSLPNDCFSVVIHDPPAHALAGELYGLEFYKEIGRVCMRGAVLFHYIGDPQSQESGKLYQGTAMRLKQAGFRDIHMDSAAYGLVASFG